MDASVNQQLCMSEMDGQECEHDVHLPTLLLLLLRQTCDDASQMLQHNIPRGVQGQAAVLLLLSHSQVSNCESKQEVWGNEHKHPKQCHNLCNISGSDVKEAVT